MGDVFALALTNLGRRRLQSLLTGAGSLVSVAAIVALYTLANGPARTWSKGLSEAGVHVVGYERGVLHMVSSQLPVALGSRIAEDPAVAEATPVWLRIVPLGTGKAEPNTGQVPLSGIPRDSYQWRHLPIVSGRKPTPGEEDVVVLGADMARELGLKIDDRLELMWKPFRVVGIARFDTLINNRAVVTSGAVVRALTHTGATASAFYVRLRTPDDAAVVDRVLSRLNSLAPNAAFVRSDNVIRSSRVIDLFRAIAWAVSAVAIGMGVLAIANTLLMAITERSREIAILAAIGWSRWRIMATVWLEGTILAVAGGIVGVGLGIALAFGLAEHPILRGFVEPVVDAGLVLWIGVAILVLSTLGSAYPAWQASRVNLVRALQNE